jgi:DUF917 family protein
VRLLGAQEIEDIATGSAVLGTGGGGDPYLGKLAALQAIEKHGPFKLYKIDELDDDALCVCPFGIGSPVPFLERITLDVELKVAHQAMEHWMGRKIDALISVEIGGMNSVIPFTVAADLNLPIIDGDGMGRAYPEGQLVTFTIYGHGAAPMAVADARGNSVVVNSIDNFWAERLGRPAAIQFGAIAGGFGYPITVRDLKEAAVLDSVSYAERIGVAIREARRKHADPIDAVAEVTKGFRLFDGRIVDVIRRQERGWTLGETVIEGLNDYAGRRFTIRFQNEHLVVIENDEVIVSVPDLIAILGTERGDPITTEQLRYGFRVSVLGIPCDPKWRTAAGIELGGPRHFGYDIDFVPVEERFKKGCRVMGDG